MSFKEIKMNAVQLSELYGSHLVNAEKNSTITGIVTEQTRNVIGKNKKHFLWVIDVASPAIIGDEDFVFLNKVITACGMSMDDIALVNLAHSAADIETLISEFEPIYIIISGVNKLTIPVQFPLYQPENMDGIGVMCTDSLASMAGDKSLKSKLWFELKKWLGIKKSV